MAMIAKYNRPSGNTVDWAFYVNGDDDLVFYYSPTGNISGGISQAVDIGTLVTGVWYHFAAQRVGDNVELLFDGDRVLETVDWFDGNKLFNNTSNPVTIGRYYDTSVTARSRALDGWIDGVRVHVGANLYPDASTYTVPTIAPFVGLSPQADRDLLLLHHFEGADFFATDRAQETDDGQRSTRISFISGGRYLDADPKFGVTHGDAGDNDGFEFTPSLFWWELLDEDFTIDIWFQARDTEAQQPAGGHLYFAAGSVSFPRRECSAFCGFTCRPAPGHPGVALAVNPCRENDQGPRRYDVGYLESCCQCFPFLVGPPDAVISGVDRVFRRPRCIPRSRR